MSKAMFSCNTRSPRTATSAISWLLDLVGPQSFADTTIKQVENWTYKPATMDGKAVATVRTLQTTFASGSGVGSARREIIRLYSRATAQVKDGALDQAKATLDEGQAMLRLNFYERGMMANLASMIALRKKDYLEARRLTEFATEHGTDSSRAAPFATYGKRGSRRPWGWAI